MHEVVVKIKCLTNGVDDSFKHSGMVNTKEAEQYVLDRINSTSNAESKFEVSAAFIESKDPGWVNENVYTIKVRDGQIIETTCVQF